MGKEQVVLYSTQDEVAVITLNRPTRMNAWTPAMRRQLFDAFDIAENDPAVKVVVLTGAGRAFCAGADLAPPKQQPETQTQKPASDPTRRDTRSPLHAMDIAKPVIW
jgi:enoyl-CoA hydratase/carnithine racemase